MVAVTAAWGAVLDEGRRLAESLMLDTCDVHSPVSGAVFDEGTGLYSGGVGALLYSGKCKRVAAKRFEKQASSGGREYVDSRDELHLPMSAPRVTAGCLATLTAAPLDPNAVGQKMYVSGPASGTLTTAQRLRVTEVVG